MEEYAYILDYLPQGRADEKGYRKTPVALALGETEFKLLELVPKPDAGGINVGDRVYIGKDAEKRDKIAAVRRRISYKELTSAAANELPYIIEDIVKQREKFFVDFFNRAEPINTRMHTLELLPGLGNKTMWNILEERKKRPFESFEDLVQRIKTIHNPPEDDRQPYTAGARGEEREVQAICG